LYDFPKIGTQRSTSKVISFELMTMWRSMKWDSIHHCRLWMNTMKLHISILGKQYKVRLCIFNLISHSFPSLYCPVCHKQWPQCRDQDLQLKGHIKATTRCWQTCCRLCSW
jgi:hypothetical protein